MSQPARGVRGFILRSPVHPPCFRVYESEDKAHFTDYDLVAFDVEIEIIDDDIVLIKDSKGARLDYRDPAPPRPPK